MSSSRYEYTAGDRCRWWEHNQLPCAPESLQPDRRRRVLLAVRSLGVTVHNQENCPIRWPSASSRREARVWEPGLGGSTGWLRYENVTLFQTVYQTAVSESFRPVVRCIGPDNSSSVRDGGPRSGLMSRYVNYSLYSQETGVSEHETATNCGHPPFLGGCQKSSNIEVNGARFKVIGVDIVDAPPGYCTTGASRISRW